MLIKYIQWIFRTPTPTFPSSAPLSLEGTSEDNEFGYSSDKKQHAHIVNALMHR